MCKSPKDSWVCRRSLPPSLLHSGTVGILGSMEQWHARQITLATPYETVIVAVAVSVIHSSGMRGIDRGIHPHTFHRATIAQLLPVGIQWGRLSSIYHSTRHGRQLLRSAGSRKPIQCRGASAQRDPI